VKAIPEEQPETYDAGTVDVHCHYLVKYHHVGKSKPDRPVKESQIDVEEETEGEKEAGHPDDVGVDKKKAKHWGWTFHLSAHGSRFPVKYNLTVIEWSIGNPDYGVFGQRRAKAIGHGGYHSTGGWKHKVSDRRRKHNRHSAPPHHRRVPTKAHHYFGMFIWNDRHQVQKINRNTKRINPKF